MILGNAISPLKVSVVGGAVANPLWNGLQNAYLLENDFSDSIDNDNGSDVNGTDYEVGKSGNAYEGTPSGHYGAFTNGAWNETGDFTVSLWVKDAAYLTNHQYMGNLIEAGGNAYGWQIANVSGKVRFWYGKGVATKVTLESDDSIGDDVWTNIICEHEQGVGNKIWVNNGTVKQNVDASNVSYTATHYPTIGAYDRTPSSIIWYHLGLLDEMYLWNRKLTSDERTELQTTFYTA